MVVNRGKSNFIMQLISEFVFMEKDVDSRRNGPSNLSQYGRTSTYLNQIEEFQVVLALIEYFSQPGPESTRNAVFLSLFGSNLNHQRTRILCKLVSASISGAVAPLLSSIGTWMQQVGCDSLSSFEVIQNIVSDFVIFSYKSTEQLKQLPLVAPHFAANVMTSVTDFYINDLRTTMISPPDGLIDVFCEWLTDNSNLCMASQQPLALPSGAIAMPVIIPLISLIRWSVLSPFVTNSIKYSSLHLTILRTFIEISAEAPTKVINAQDLERFIEPLTNFATQINNKVPPKQSNLRIDNDALQTSLERLAQVVHVGISSGCIFGNISQLLSILETLPPHTLMNIIIKKHRHSTIIPETTVDDNSKNDVVVPMEQ